MSMIFCDSVQGYSTTQNHKGYTTPNSFAVTTNATFRTGKQSLSVDGSHNCAQTVPNKTTYIVGFAFNTGLGAGPIFSFGDSGTDQVIIGFDSTEHITAKRGFSTLLGTSTATVSTGVWHYIEIKVLISTTVGTVDIHLDGVSVLSLTGQNTQSTGTAQINEALFWGTYANIGAPAGFIQDIVILDTTGSAPNNSFLGDVQVLYEATSGDGSTQNYTFVFATFLNSHGYVVGETFEDSNGNVQQCTIAGTSQSVGTPTWATTGGATTTSSGATFVVLGTGSNPGNHAWMAVNEAPSDSNSSYVTDATVSDIELFTYPNLPTATSQVYAVAVNINAEKDDSGLRTIRAEVKSSGTSADNGSDFALTLNSYADYQALFPTDPNTGVQWTKTGVNAAQFGVKTTN